MLKYSSVIGQFSGLFVLNQLTLSESVTAIFEKRVEQN